MRNTIEGQIIKNFSMRNLYLFFSLIFFLNLPVYGGSYPEVIFDNSALGGSYGKSVVNYDGGSWLENVNMQLPVSDSLFFTPGNSLSLKYFSYPEGEWSAYIRYGRLRNHYRITAQDILNFRVYIDSDVTKASDLPGVFIQQRDSCTDTLHLVNYIQDVRPGEWMEVQIPIGDFEGLETSVPINGVGFCQGGGGNELTHHLFIDQIEFNRIRQHMPKLTSPAVLTKLKTYGNTVHLQWSLPLTPSIRYVKIYRSEDNENYEPIAIRPIYMMGAIDQVDEASREYYYKITWVDYDYDESPASREMKTEPSELDEESLFNLTQYVHVNYFLENYDINSGMFIPARLGDRAVVSVKETGYALLNLIVAVENSWVSRDIASRRINKIIKFLEGVQHKEGVFMPYYDGRKGIPDYFYNQSSYDLNATTSILEALLVAREYFTEDNKSESMLRENVTKLWERVNWQTFLYPESEDVLYSSRAYLVNQDTILTLGGINEGMNTYMLAMSSPTHGIAKSAFENGILHQDVREEPRPRRHRSRWHRSIRDGGESVMAHELLDEEEVDEFLEGDAEEMDNPEELYALRESVFSDTTAYGLELPWDIGEESLTKMFRPFMTIDPSGVMINGLSAEEALKKYMLFHKRKDNEEGIGGAHGALWGRSSLTDSLQISHINPAISVSSIFLDRLIAKDALEILAQQYRHFAITEYGFRAWINLRNHEVSDGYWALNQSLVGVMIENAKSGLIWKLYENIPEVKKTREQLFGNNN